jgi:hypothetical protein
VNDIPDEVFINIFGGLQLEYRDRIAPLNEGDICVVPKGTAHRPICTSEVTCLLVEKAGTLIHENTGGTYQTHTQHSGSAGGESPPLTDTFGPSRISKNVRVHALKYKRRPYHERRRP